MTVQPQTVYKILTATEMESLERDGRFDGSAVDDADGFIHLSTDEQLTETADKHFAGQDILHVIAVDVAANGERMKWEASRGGALFPHLYGPLLLETVVAYGTMERADSGRVVLPVAG